MQTNHDLTVKALALLKNVDSVELKVTVPDTDHRSALAALHIDILDAELRQAVFFDSRDLKLDRAGLVVRARRIRKGADTVIKLRPIAPDKLDRELRQSASFRVDQDAMPGTLLCSGSLRGKATNSDVEDVLRSQLPIARLFSKEQRLLYKTYAPKGLPLDGLISLGPVNIAKVKIVPPELKRALTAEMWFFPDGSRVLELSTKCAPTEAFQVLTELRVFLNEQGIHLTKGQETKTRKALEYFSRFAGRKAA